MGRADAAMMVLALLLVAGATPPKTEPARTASPPAGRYRLSGARELRPIEMSDDGVHTYIRWTDEQELPAVFALNARGDEEIVDGYMRNGVFTIDRVNARLVFRIDDHVARAVRSGVER